ncbi:MULTISPECIES: hypothetical protein [unclassified Sulfitobacter]|uniref:hypothetical protein n=1 Tax=unclassified Sulfitobacter TaxID=196795 RepID=UPI0023E1A290|nr:MULTISPECIES: hypothetical protein [unclassified Sulfitobacter]
MRQLAALVMILALTACAAKGPEAGSETQIAALAQNLRQMSPDVDPQEAARAARISYQTAFALAQTYQITDHPLIHNSKVNAGTKPRGLCYHWAEDMQARLLREGFKTLDVTRAIANAHSRILIDHSTAVLIPKGAAMTDGVVIDPWRGGGRLFWAPVKDDQRYDWLPRAQVLRELGRIHYIQRTDGSLAPPPVD